MTPEKARPRAEVTGAGLPEPAHRDQAAEGRDQDGAQRDQAAARRDSVGDGRDRTAEQHDRAAEQHDLAAEQRDRAAEQRETGSASGTRGAAASDRTAASQDRHAGATRRTEAEIDRGSSLLDRESSAGDRGHAERDRQSSLAERVLAAEEREGASHDQLTGVSLRGAGFVALNRDIARAKRTAEPLVLAFIDVDGLKAVNDSEGHAAGDRLLLEVANALRARLRPYDLIIRYGGDEFICAILGLSLDEATKRLALVNETLAADLEHGSVTVGLADLRPEDSLETLVARADGALYRERDQRRGA